jgi:hypothetical protein
MTPRRPRRRARPPAEVLRQLELAPAERPLAWAADRAGRWHVGTDQALHVADVDGFHKLRWEQVERADWHRDDERLVVVEVADWGEPERRHDINVADPGQLLELLRERVTKSVLTTVYAAVRGRAGLSVVARRSPVGTGPVAWSYVLAEGLHPNDPDVEEVAERTLRQAAAGLADL